MVTIEVVEAKTWKEKILGLFLYKEPINLLIKTRFGIHSFGMKYPIDVVILDRNSKVVSLKENLKPNRIFIWNLKYDTVLELPVGTVRKFYIQRGSRITFK